MRFFLERDALEDGQPVILAASSPATPASPPAERSR
jgi:hypothetical protein